MLHDQEFEGRSLSNVLTRLGGSKRRNHKVHKHLTYNYPRVHTTSDRLSESALQIPLSRHSRGLNVVWNHTAPKIRKKV